MDTSPCITPQLVAVLARSAVLIICAIAGVLCIYLGWRLYKEAILSHTESEAKTSSFSVKIVSAGPGVFFAAFGMWLLVSIVNRPFQTAGIMPSPEPRHAYSLYSHKNSSFLHVTDSIPADSKVPSCTPCGGFVFFDGQSIDNDSINEAIDLAIKEIAKGNPTAEIEGFSINRVQAINILTKIKIATKSDHAL